MRAQVFNALIGGTDAHGKNYSIIYEPGGAFRLTPLYDVISFLPYQQRRSQLLLAMTIGEKRAIDEIRAEHWQRASEICAYDGERVVAELQELAAKLPDLAATVRTACDKAGLRHPMLDQLVNQIVDNAGRVGQRT